MENKKSRRREPAGVGFSGALEWRPRSGSQPVSLGPSLQYSGYETLYSNSRETLRLYAGRRRNCDFRSGLAPGQF
jgi:hypothetical protein